MIAYPEDEPNGDADFEITFIDVPFPPPLSPAERERRANERHLHGPAPETQSDFLVDFG